MNKNDRITGGLLELLPVISTAPANRSKAEVAKLSAELSCGEVVSFDGAIKEHNPGGVATFGWVHRSNGVVMASGGGIAVDGPGATVNVAEYAGLCAAIGYIATLDPCSIKIVGDSQLVVRQVNGTNTVRAAHLIPWVKRAKRAITTLVFRGYRITLGWVVREVNTFADEQANKAYLDYRRE